VSEWLKVMLDEIKRKQRERDEALRERQRRASSPAGATPGNPKDAPGAVAPGRD
jgi:hypothetical protein